MTTSVKALLDMGSDTGISVVSECLLSLGIKNTAKYTSIGSVRQTLEESKISLLDSFGIVQNIYTQSSNGKAIGPEKIKSQLWYDTAFVQLFHTVPFHFLMFQKRDPLRY